MDICNLFNKKLNILSLKNLCTLAFVKIYFLYLRSEINNICIVYVKLAFGGEVDKHMLFA